MFTWTMARPLYLALLLACLGLEKGEATCCHHRPCDTNGGGCGPPQCLRNVFRIQPEAIIHVDIVRRCGADGGDAGGGLRPAPPTLPLYESRGGRGIRDVIRFLTRG